MDGAVFPKAMSSSATALVKVLNSPAHQFSGVNALAVDGADLFVSNNGDYPSNNFGGSVTEVDAATGRLVRVFGSDQYNVSYPQALAVSGSDLFVPMPNRKWPMSPS